MFPFLAFLTSASALGMLFAGCLVLLRNPSKRQNQVFFILSLVLSLWVPCNFLGSNIVHPTATRILVDFDLSLGLLIGWAMLYFLSLFPRENTKSFVHRSKPFLLTTGTLNVLLIILVFSGQVANVSVDTGVLELDTGVVFIVYASILSFYMIFAFKNLVVAYFKTRNTDRHALNLVSAGFFVAAVSNVLTNLVFPEIFFTRQTIQQLNVLGYIGVLILVLCLYVAITTRRLFDIRLVIARSLAYLFSVTLLAGAYGLITYSLTSLVEEGANGATALSTVVSVAFIALMLTSYGPLRRFFDKVTNKLFYRDAYDAQAFIDQLNKQLVSNIDLEVLLTQCSNIIVENLKAEYCLFGLKETAYSPQRIIGNHTKEFDQDDLKMVRAETPIIRQAVIVTDEIDDNAGIKSKLHKYDIAVLARLTTEPELEIEGLGYLILGQKKSGNPYNKQDINLIEIISNELVIAIQNALRFEEIEKFNITLQEKVDDATRRLKHSNEKLKQMDETKDEFISMASHQLRTPLTSVKGYLSMVLEGDAGELPEMQKKLLSQAFVSSQRMVYLIADLLNVSRLRTGKFVIEAIASNLADVIESEVQQLHETAEGRGLKLKYEKPQNFPTLYLDETKIRQVIMNFMDNAIYYTPTGGEIHVELKDLGQTVEFTVSDNGLGVPKSEQAHLFTKFYRAVNAKKARPDGTGLGLFMAKKVVVAQEGSIIFKSEEGKGSTFGFTFDKSKLQPKPDSTDT